MSDNNPLVPSSDSSSEIKNNNPNSRKANSKTFQKGIAPIPKGSKHIPLIEKAKKARPRWTPAVLAQLALHFGCTANLKSIKEAILSNPELAESWDAGVRPNKIKLPNYTKSKYNQFKDLLIDPNYINCELYDLCHIVGIDEATGVQWKHKISKSIKLLDKSKLRKEAIEESLEILLMEGIRKIRSALNNPEEIKKAKDIITMISTIQATYKSNITTNIVQLQNDPVESTLPEVKITLSDDSDSDDASNKIIK